MSSINLRPLSQQPQSIEPEAYARHIAQRGEQGWSTCANEEEWLCKLHYLRQGLLQGKLGKEDFLKRETRLINAWIRRLR